MPFRNKSHRTMEFAWKSTTKVRRSIVGIAIINFISCYRSNIKTVTLYIYATWCSHWILFHWLNWLFFAQIPPFSSIQITQDWECVCVIPLKSIEWKPRLEHHCIDRPTHTCVILCVKTCKVKVINAFTKRSSFRRRGKKRRKIEATHII